MKQLFNGQEIRCSSLCNIHTSTVIFCCCCCYSFQMAHMFPDSVGEVDVVSDAENIKKLLKIPYSSSPVSKILIINNNCKCDSLCYYITYVKTQGEL